MSLCLLPSECEARNALDWACSFTEVSCPIEEMTCEHRNTPCTFELGRKMPKAARKKKKKIQFGLSCSPAFAITSLLSLPLFPLLLLPQQLQVEQWEAQKNREMMWNDSDLLSLRSQASKMTQSPSPCLPGDAANPSALLEVWHCRQLKQLVISINKGDFPKVHPGQGSGRTTLAFSELENYRANCKIPPSAPFLPPRAGSPGGARHRGHSAEPPPGAAGSALSPAGKVCQRFLLSRGIYGRGAPSLLSPKPLLGLLTGDRSPSGWRGR